ncbi:hypothetical protein H310_14182 [Aphanomyces invadans]|uniref:PLAC8 family protein n=1 Tax=Aphanomyces invadans TaxID=157072 RepID=A0A024TAK5_9STRA|nr:hypothetical protein H310_14182 [Aphanomyces invadans]ETV91180.1 hypothetical protein H310_14182 [Aphanomyces invadans]|eukprot:XP_008880211.1 hypothetical protein H310_14182 [Aphanomyces invadans]
MSTQEQPTAVTSVPDVKVVVVDDGQANTVLVTGQWKSGLCGCCASIMPNCLCAWCCPCVSLAQTVARLGVGDFMITVLAGCLLLLTGVGGIVFIVYVFYLRFKLRTALKIPGSAVGDCCAALCCNCCVLAQLATHTESYTPGRCSFSPKDTLPGYSDLYSRATAPVQQATAVGVPTKTV